jgi:hypothetical protein
MVLYAATNTSNLNRMSVKAAAALTNVGKARQNIPHLRIKV